MARNDPARAAAILHRAREEAKAVGSPGVEAEHAYETLRPDMEVLVQRVGIATRCKSRIPIAP